MDISYLTEDPAPRYVKALNEAKTLDDLRHVVCLYRQVASDAEEVVEKMETKDFLRWREGLEKERRKQFAGEEFAKEFGAVLLPEVMMMVSLTAHQFKAPWGCAYIRCRDVGRITEHNGAAKWHNKIQKKKR